MVRRVEEPGTRKGPTVVSTRLMLGGSRGPPSIASYERISISHVLPTTLQPSR